MSLSALLPVIGTALMLGFSAPASGHSGLQDPFEAALVLRTPGAPEVHLFPRPGSGAVTLRLSFPAREPEWEAGSLQLVRALAAERMTGMAARMGVEARVQRTPEALVYSVSGPASELDFLARVLNEGLRAPEPDRFAEVRRRQLAEVLRRQETPQGTLALRIRQAAGGSGTPLLGSSVALERMHAGVVTGAWERTHRPDQARIIVVGDLEVEVMLATLADLALPTPREQVDAAEGGVMAQPRMTPEVIRHWVARAWTLDQPRDARGLVAVALLGEAARTRSGDWEVGAELWEVSGRWTLVISGAAYPRNQQAMRRQLDGLLDEAAGRVTPSAVEGHAARIRGDLLRQASTPWGLAELVGEAMDAGMEPRMVRILLDDLTRLSADQVTALFSDLRSRTPIRDEVRP